MNTTEVTAEGLTMTRIIDAPVKAVWNAWTDPEALQHWWGQPKKATMPVYKSDFRVGGSDHYQVVIPGEFELWGKKTYTKIIPNERLEFADYYSNENGDEIVNDESPASHIIAIFEDMDGKTKLTVHHNGIGDSPIIDSYKQGWSESLDRLQESL